MMEQNLIHKRLKPHRDEEIFCCSRANEQWAKSQLCWSVSLDLQYHFIDKKMSWSEAQSHCREQHTDLASVNDMKDLKNLKAAANGRTDAWIGLHQTSDKLTDKKWHWSQPTVRYKEGDAPWAPGEPNDSGGIENCGMIITVIHHIVLSATTTPPTELLS
uniref:C-type lectin domain-containing protein n=1 Tax=Knipowitschia caucasica TaxID=637954 RepID=A0AAV2KM70_KNICA